MTHPAQFSTPILDKIETVLSAEFGDAPISILDPFAGVGNVHRLNQRRPHWLTHAVEIEPEWAVLPAWAGPGAMTICADSTDLSAQFDDNSFDAVVTSPACGNRMADAYDGRDGSKRRTYRLSLGRPLSENNGAGMQWGDAYRELHTKVWAECWRILKPGGILILNVADHIRKKEVVAVSKWHSTTLLQIGFHLVEQLQIETRKYGYGANRDARTPGEWLLVFRKPLPQ